MQQQQQHHTAGERTESGSSVRAPHTIVLNTQKSQLNSLGFQLNENEIVDKGAYFVKYVDPNSASALAGLKEGDKITKINGKTTAGMSYEQFCYEIVVAQQQQQKNNMIHLMVMRRSAKVNSTATVLPIRNNLASGEKVVTSTSILSTSTSSNLADEGYVQGSATSATSSTTNAVSSTSIPYSLVSVVRVTSPTTTTASGKNSIHV